MNIKDRVWYPVGYMFAVTVVFSGILIGLSAATRERVEQNRLIFRERAILVAMSQADDTTPNAIVHERYVNRVQPVKIDPDGDDDLDNVLEYRWLDDTGRPAGPIAVPVYGRGYWDRILGAIGLQADGETVIGIAFFEQNETPGLGAEITTPQWREQFEGKVLAPGDRPLDIRPPTQPLDESSVHAVTGATQTSIRVQRLLNERLVAWRQAGQEGQGP